MSVVCVPVLAFLLAGCETVNQITEAGAQIAVEAGVIRENEGQAITRSVGAMTKAFEDITPEQEYYIGRSVAATLLAQYTPSDDRVLTHYVNVLGQTLALSSDKAETFGGYRFMVLDTDEVNAFAAPGGLILVSRGLIACCKNEDELAAVLAHEVAHVQHSDGLRAISSSRLTTALTIIGTESAKIIGGEDLTELVGAFEGSINDITQTLAVNGYSRKQEYEADAAAVKIMQRVGYDPHALIPMLEEMEKRTSHSGLGFARTHPAPSARIQQVRGLLGKPYTRHYPPERQRRFETATASLR